MTSTGQTPEDWAFQKIQQDVQTGAIRCLGKVGEVDPPHVVLPLGLELTKPRLITDARFVNLWCDPGPFRLDSVGQVPETFRSDGAFCNYDHKSGYHHFRFVEDEQGYFGFCLRGYYYVFAAGCFGYSKMPEIYHVTHDALLQFAQREFAVPSLGYLDDGLTGTMFGARTDPEWVLGSARYAMGVLGWLNFLAGYSVSEKKSIFEPCREIVWLGILIDARTNQFFIPQAKKEKLLELIGSVSRSEALSIAQLESIAGKCVSLQLAVGDAAKVYTRAMFDTLVQVQRGRLWSRKWVGKTRIFSIAGDAHRALRKSLDVWCKFITVFEGAPWLQTYHTEVRIQTDASGRAWGGCLKDASGATVLSVGQEFDPTELHLDIETKEAMAVVRTLLGIVESRGWDTIRGARLNLFIDNLSLVYAMANGASRNVTTHAEIETLFWMKMRHNFTTNAIWWDTKANWEADAVTRTERDNDWRLTRPVFCALWAEWGPFDFDLMASAVSVQRDLQGAQLPFFSRYFCPGSSGVDVLAQPPRTGSLYCFPHRKMVRAVVAHLSTFDGACVTLITPQAETSWLPRVREHLRAVQMLPAGAVVAADLTPVPVGFVASLLCF
jgi:hypothetical protein